MKALAVAIERRDWELAALCLLVGVTQAAEKLPAETVDQLIELLAAEPSVRRAEDTHRRRADYHGRHR